MKKRKMRSLSNLGLALSLVFGSLLLALVAELYYLLWWKKRITNREVEDGYSRPAREFLCLFCWKKLSSLSSITLNPQQLCSSVRIIETHVHEPQAMLRDQSNMDFCPKTFGEDGVEAELMRLQNLSGPPRFLFTIKEETNEDSESEDGNSRKGSRSRSLSSDLLLTVETPFFTPIASPPYFTPPLTPMASSFNYREFNPLYESSRDAEIGTIRSSPPPQIKFLKDNEDKFNRRKLNEEIEEEVRKIDGSFQEGAKVSSTSEEVQKIDGSFQEWAKVSLTSEFLKDEENGSFITLIVAKQEERELNDLQHNVQHYHSSSSQVFPLASSPSTIRLPNNKKTHLTQELH